MGQIQRRDDPDGEGDPGPEPQPGILLGGMEDLGVEDELVYDMADWSERDLEVLRDRLDRYAVPHRWEDASLVIAAGDEAWVERIFDQVDDDLALALDPEVPQVAYDLSGWMAERSAELLEALTDEEIPHGWDGQELFVHEIDEELVDELVDEVLGPDGDDSDEDGGDGDGGGDGADAEPRVDGHRAMGELFVAADKLRNAPHGTATRQGFTDAAEAVAAASAPYGIEKAWWTATVESARSLVGLLDAAAALPTPDDDDTPSPVVEAATALRDRLHPMV